MKKLLKKNSFLYCFIANLLKKIKYLSWKTDHLSFVYLNKALSKFEHMPTNIPNELLSHNTMKYNQIIAKIRTIQFLKLFLILKILNMSLV